MNKIEQIKAELKRLKNDWASLDDELTDTMVAEYDYLLDFLSTLESEKPMQEELEEEIDRFEDWMETYNQADYPTSFTTRDIARHFYDLGCRRTAEKYDEIEYNRQRAEESVCKDLEKEIDFQTFSKEMGAVFALPKERTENTEEEPLRWEYEIARHFAKWQKEQMMKEAVEGMVEYDYSTGDTDYLRVLAEISSNQFDVKDGDKVRIIIVKEDL